MLQKQGNDKILVELPGIKTAEDEQRARELIAKAAHLQLMAVDEKRRDRANNMSPTEAAQYGDVILVMREVTISVTFLKKSLLLMVVC